MKRNCDICNFEYDVKQSDLNRGWGLTCSKKCAALKRGNKTNTNKNVNVKQTTEYKTQTLYRPDGYSVTTDVNGDEREIYKNPYENFR